MLRVRSSSPFSPPPAVLGAASIHKRHLSRESGGNRASCFCKLELRGGGVHKGALSHFHCAISSFGGEFSRESKFAQRHVSVSMFTALLYFHLAPTDSDE